MLKILATVSLLGLGLSACATDSEVRMFSSFEPIAEGFRFKSIAISLYPKDDPVAEARRMGVLQTFLDLNSMSPAGYEITERKAVMTDRVGQRSITTSSTPGGAAEAYSL